MGYDIDIEECERTTREEEQQLALRIKNGDISARNELVERNLKLARKIADEYKGLGIERDDLIQYANMGLIKAAEKFDPYKNTRFGTYAYNWIKAYVLRALYSDGKIRRPEREKRRSIDYNRWATEYIETHNGEQPTIEDICERYKCSKEQAKLISLKYDFISIDETGNENGTRLEETIIGSDSAEWGKETWEREAGYNELVKLLGEKDAYIVWCVGAEGKHYVEIAKEIGVTHEAIRQRYVKAIGKLKTHSELIEYLT